MTERDTLAEQMDELNQSVRELRDEALLKPASKLLNRAGVETVDIDEVSEDISLIETAGVVLLAPVLAYFFTVVGMYAAVRLGVPPVLGVGLGIVGAIVVLDVTVRHLDPVAGVQR